jgi:hypothetical protein
MVQMIISGNKWKLGKITEQNSKKQLINEYKENLKEALSLLDDVSKALETVLQRSLDGDKNPRWKGWYDPGKRRPNNGFPKQEMLKEIKLKLETVL